MELMQFFNNDKCVFALEVFPPKRQSGIESVFKTLDQIGEVPAAYISVTYSAGGSGAKEYTAQISQYLKDKLSIEPLAHLTCGGSNKSEIGRELDALRSAGVSNILALRGDRIPGAVQSTDYTYASDLMEEISAYGGFYMVGACYPEGHPESASLAQDIDNLRHKLAAGAGHLVSQLFFDNGKFYRFLNLARKKGITVPIEAGVMPVVKVDQIKRTISLSSSSVPAEFSKLVTRYENDPDSFYEAGLDYAIRQIRDLVEGGADGIHLYAMNQPNVAKRVWAGISDLFI